MNVNPISVSKYSKASSSVNNASSPIYFVGSGDCKDKSDSVVISTKGKSLSQIGRLAVLAASLGFAVTVLPGCSKDSGPVAPPTEEVDPVQQKIAENNKIVADLYLNYLGLAPTSGLGKTSSIMGVNIPAGTLTAFEFTNVGNVFSAGKYNLTYSTDLTTKDATVYEGTCVNNNNGTGYVRYAYSPQSDGSIKVKKMASVDKQTWGTENYTLKKTADGVVETNVAHPDEPTKYYPVNSTTVKGVMAPFNDEFTQKYSKIVVK